ncbi:MAG TPA: EamA/RhaT family transporter [Actinobacteria bacterium]|nr:EamA/RhaT family transporter [Actinomycetota bacterium]
MPLLLAGLSSLAFGVADFVGGFVTRRAAAITVVWGGQVVGLAAVAAVAPAFSSGFAADPSLLWGAGAGAAGSLGLVVFYHALATTRISVAAPVAAVVGTALPVLFGVAIGERPAPIAWAGMLLAIPAVVSLSASRRDSGPVVRAAWLGAIAGAAFACFGILISRTGSDSGMWPLVAARVASVITLGVGALAWGRPVIAPRVHWPLITVSALLDIAGNVLFLVAVRRELLSLVAVIMSLYPATTLALARIVLGERLTGRQWVGVTLAAGAVVLIALG